MIKKVNLETLLKKNESLLELYKNNSIMQLIKSTEIEDKSVRERLLDCIQIFSNYFQKAVMIRYVSCENREFSPVVQEHLKEEFSHNFSLDADRCYRPPVWDPLLDATACWFTWKMLVMGAEEKTVLMHLVLEASANIFFQEAHKVMRRYGETDYFKAHAKADAKHEKMGIELLRGLSSKKYKSLLSVQQQGWEMLYAVCDRIAFLTKKSQLS